MLQGNVVNTHSNQMQWKIKRERKKRKAKHTDPNRTECVCA